jgi:hypothetical protein
VIVCGHSKVEVKEGMWKVRMDETVESALNLFPGQVLFGAREEGSDRFFLSPLRLNPHAIYFRVFLEDVRGSLAAMTEIFSEKGINLLSGGAFGFGNIWVSEFIADFKGVDVEPEAVVSEIEGLGGFVTPREITELFPRAFELASTFEIESDEPDGMYLMLPGYPQGTGTGNDMYAVLKAWPRVQALFIDFYSSTSGLVKITAKIRDVPGSLNELSSLLGSQVNLIAIHEQHHNETSGEWTIYGVLEIGGLDELRERTTDVSSIIELNVEPLGWDG